MSNDLITQLPPELLGEVFFRCALLNPDAPLVLSQVSSTFNRVVTATPRAWERLRLEFPVGTGTGITPGVGCMGETDAVLVRKADKWFERSGACMLEVWIRLEGSVLGEDGEDLNLEAGLGRAGDHVQRNHPICASSHLRLPYTLASQISRIRALTLKTTTQSQTHTFLASMYNAPGFLGLWTPTSIPLKMLRITITSDVAPARSTAPNTPTLGVNTNWNGNVTIPSDLSGAEAVTPFNLLPLPSLTLLKLNNYTLTFLSPSNLSNLRELSLVGPIRCPPISIDALLDVLQRTVQLRKLEIEARLLVSSPSSTSSSTTESPTLITLPLTSLHLRTNNIPSLLSFLVLPHLRQLYLNDLDGKRPGAGQETGEVLRKVLVRMDLPTERYGRGMGIEELELVGVNLDCGVEENMEHQEIGYVYGSQGEAGCSKNVEDVWEWCFKRMCTLRRVSATGCGKAGRVLGLMMPLFPSSSSSLSSHIYSHPNDLSSHQTTPTDLPCPLLAQLSISDPLCPPSSRELERFRRLRSGVRLDMGVNTLGFEFGGSGPSTADCPLDPSFSFRSCGPSAPGRTTRWAFRSLFEHLTQGTGGNGDNEK
ncbi:hypothetical protein BDQ12DRAFT_322219 [Crucibulum laeve]|uniref:F-box domain-containing protein n=1 Tax=Crucibulum laeve TaxID=68775 RepID=A0A5C3LRJ6_9AGAR|nr:hypothetical protein BDQ12DRAFT_322219 [Crucibulum laeve]